MAHFRSSKGATTIQLIIIIAIIIVAIGGAFLFTRPSDNTPPVAVLSSNSTEAQEDKPITFSADESSDNVGITSYNWDFGDGTTGIGENIIHTYSEIGNFTVELTTTDKAGNVEKETMIIVVSQAFPSERSTLIITDPNQDYQFNASNGITVFIPKDAVIPNTKIVVKNVQTSVIDKPQWSQEILTAYDISSDIPLKNNITLSFPIPNSGLIGLGHFHNGEWVLLDFIIEEEKAIVEVKELSEFSWNMLDIDIIVEHFIELVSLRVLNQDPTFQPNEIEIPDQDPSIEYIKGGYMRISDNQVKVKIFNVAPLALDVYPFKKAEISYRSTPFFSEENWGIIIPPNEYGEWIVNTDEVPQVTFGAYVGQHATALTIFDLVPLMKRSRSLFYAGKYLVEDGKSLTWDDFFQGILKPSINTVLKNRPKVIEYFRKMFDIAEMESFEFDQLSIDFTQASSDSFLQVDNGGFEEEFTGEGWGIQGWFDQGIIGKLPGFIGQGISLHKSELFDSYISQNIDFEVETNILSFWIKPFPRGNDITILCYLDNNILYQETYSGNDDDFTWENIQLSIDASIGSHELKFLLLSGSGGVVPGSEGSVNMADIPKIFIDEIWDAQELESFGSDDSSTDSTQASSDSFLQVDNGGFEEEYTGEGWGIQGWFNQGNTGKTDGYVGQGISLIKSTLYQSFISQIIDFEVESNVLSFWIKPSPNGYAVIVQCYLDQDIIFIETYRGNDDFTWENIQLSIDTSIGSHELKFLLLSGSGGMVPGSERSVVWSDIPHVIIDEIG